jgi:fumarate reductase flavoprotein subunit
MELDRRSFIKGAALTGALAATAGLAACTSPADAPAAGGGAPAAGGPVATGGGTRYTKYSNPDEIGTIHDTSDEETVDVVVIGTGVTGLSTGMLAAEQAPDAKVLIIDKISGPGGNTNFAEINEGGLAMPWEEALARAIEHVDGQMDLTDPYLYAHYYADNGKVSAWFFNKRGVENASDHFFYKGHTGRTTITHLVDQINSDPAYANVELRLSTQAISLLQSDEHTVTGVQIKDVNSGGYINVNAKGVMVATGGMGTNLELLSYYTGQDVVEKSTPYGQGQEGDGHLLVESTAHGMAKNVDPTPMWAVVKDLTIESPLSCCFAMQNAGVFVNQTGTRFHNENYPGSFPSVDHSFMQQGRVYGIVGQGLIDRFKAQGSDAAMFYYFEVPTDISDELSTISSNPNVAIADTFEELAALIDVPVDAFVAEMNLYDSDAKAGKDSKFGKDAQYLVPFGDGPYYAAELSAIMMQTNNGIRINTDCQVVDPYYVPIKGLYAGGIAVSGFNTCMYSMGTAQHVGLWSGCIAALSIVKNELGGTIADDWFGPSEFTGPLPDFSNLERTKPLPGTVS